MMHHNRKHFLGTYEDSQLMAEKMTESTWTLCSAFGYAPEGKVILIFANDSTSEDAITEYGVFYKDGEKWLQFESYTIGWMKSEELAESIKSLAGQIKEYGKPKTVFNYGNYEHNFESKDHHCHLCA